MVPQVDLVFASKGASIRIYMVILYCSVNGIPACAHHELLTKILREEWGFEGYVVSDEVALEFTIGSHKYFNNTLDAAVGCVKAGCNLELSGSNPAVYMRIGRCWFDKMKIRLTFKGKCKTY